MGDKSKGKPELCDDCGVCDSNGKPCYLMFRKKTDIQKCGGYRKDPEGHAKLVAQTKNVVEGKGGEK
jgi:hypothetical protein